MPDLKERISDALHPYESGDWPTEGRIERTHVELLIEARTEIERLLKIEGEETDLRGANRALLEHLDEANAELRVLRITKKWHAQLMTWLEMFYNETFQDYCKRIINVHKIRYVDYRLLEAYDNKKAEGVTAILGKIAEENDGQK